MTCLFQAPFLPPKPTQPAAIVPDGRLDEDIRTLLQNQQYCDVIFVAQGVCIPAHKVCLVAASSVFEELFLADWSEPDSLKTREKDDVAGDNFKNGNTLSNGSHSRSASSSRSNSLKRTHNTSKDRDKGAKAQSDTAKLLDHEEGEMSSVDAVDTVGTDDSSRNRRILLNLPAFSSLEFEEVDDTFTFGGKHVQTVVTLNDNVSPAALQYVLNYLYTGERARRGLLCAPLCRALRKRVFSTQNLCACIIFRQAQTLSFSGRFRDQ